ncbi:MAG: shikimate kinase [Candidatus Omnitrophota bacterium]|nr:MAG: shikimate kinase [Candidatus Omnitrophota bacterium]
MMNIVLVGFMGTGKTAIGKLLAKKLEMKYISTDELIEHKERRSINDIFKKSGEPYFRRVEKEVVKKVAELDKFIIDAGGGVVLDKENIQNLKRNGKIICLAATSDVILERTKRYYHRPLLNTKNPKEKIEELLKNRAPFYAQADVTIDTTNMTPEEVVQEIENRLENEISKQQ